MIKCERLKWTPRDGVRTVIKWNCEGVRQSGSEVEVVMCGVTDPLTEADWYLGGLAEGGMTRAGVKGARC
ncbi:hypothetical protein E2C01_089693 [Portunus trituberculatus]|uniref:Uncharacterized protein n=1 Tax=Portunus trituberculatus TaxID=210409 RepID=A0A5B7JCQ6_PORTR|nr:hypothetical protein [Portunus trituberculatus]